jgi:hypothetical protein
MKPWEVWTWAFPDAGEHPAVILGTEERAKLKPRVCVLLCSTQRATRQAEVHEVILDQAQGQELRACSLAVPCCALIHNQSLDIPPCHLSGKW